MLSGSCGEFQGDTTLETLDDDVAAPAAEWYARCWHRSASVGRDIMETYVLGVALGAFAIALAALVRTMGPRRLLGPPEPAEALIDVSPGDDAAGTPVDRSGHPTRVLRLVRSTGRPARSTVVTDWLLRVIPGACAVAALAIVVVTFTSQNTRVVRLDFLDWHLERVPVAAAVLAAAIGSASMVAALAFMDRRRLRLTIRRLEHRLRQAGDSRRRPDRPTRARPTLGRGDPGRHAG
jgi:uncharacterized integral membrane protein